MFSSLNGSLASSSENSASTSPPNTTSPPAFSSKQPSLSSSNLAGAQPQSAASASTSTILPHSLSASSFFPTSSFPFSVPSQYAQGSIINSISNTSASTNSINTNNIPSASTKNPSITGNSAQLPNGLPPTGTSNFFPNSVSPIIEDAGSSNVNNFTALRVSNLPRDIQAREFNVLFTFAPDFVYSELLKSHSVAEDGLPSSVMGIGYFKTLPAASNAMAILSMNPHVFAPKDIFLPPNSSASPYAIKCDIRAPRKESMRIPGFNLNGTTSPNNGLAQQPQPQSSHVGMLPQQPQGPGFKNTSSRFVFPGGANGNGVLEMPPPPNFQELYGEGGVPNNLFSPTSPRTNFPVDPKYMPRVSGKSLLLESQGKEDEEYNDLVKDPVGWASRNNGYNSPNHVGPVAPVGYPGQGLPPSAATVQPPQQSQQPAPGSSAAVTKPQQGSNTSPPPSSNISATSSQQAAFKATTRPGASAPTTQAPVSAPPPTTDVWAEKRRGSTARSFQALSISGSAQPASAPGPSSAVDNSKVVVPYSPTNGGSNMHILQTGGRVLPPANPADQNPPCNTLYVGNLPPDTNEEELKELFSSRRGYKRLCFRTKANGPMCFVEFDDVNWATRALEELYGFGLSNSVKGGIRLSFSKNPLGVRSQANGSSNNGGGNNGSNGNNGSSNGNAGSSHSRLASQQQQQPMAGGGMSGYSSSARTPGYANGGSSAQQYS